MSARTNAIEAWGDPLPDWVEALADECDRTSQNKAAVRLGYTAGAISQVLRRRYAANTDAIEEQIRGALMSETIACPVLGALGKDACRKWRGRSRSSALINTLHTTMRISCRKCPHNREASHADES